jgi:hypothetical protein
MAWRLLRINFIFAVWLCIVTNCYQFLGYTVHVQELRSQFGPWMPRVALAPLLLAGAQLFLWFRFYRFGGVAGRIAAGCAGAALGLIVLIQLLRASIDIPISASGIWLYTYFAASHFAYAFLGRRAEVSAA